MTDINQSVPSSTDTDTGSSEGTAGVAREQAAHVAETAQKSSQRVVETAKDEAANVAREAKDQLSDLFAQTQEELKDQAARQQERVAAGLRSVSDELGEMARSSQSGGMATDLVHQAAAKTGDVASWLDQRDPGSLLDEVRSFARRRPGTFIAAAAVAGVLAGRLTRSVASSGDASSSGADGAVTGQPPMQRPPMQRTPRARIVPATADDLSAAPLGDADPIGSDPLAEYPASGALGTERL
ncbi:MAG TPA: hypothetical protein VGO99_08830 [Leifsonia sp.]|jgi:gas vesicle protein|nr:hypothetical protein [Leifsonia sp.]